MSAEIGSFDEDNQSNPEHDSIIQFGEDKLGGSQTNNVELKSAAIKESGHKVLGRLGSSGYFYVIPK